MSFVRTIPVESATGVVKQHYDFIQQHTGVKEVNRLMQSWSIAADVADAWMKSLAIGRETCGLDATLYELMECRIMYVMKCRYVLVNHCFLLARVSGWDRDRIRRNVHEPDNPTLGARERTVLRFAEKAVLRSHEITQSDANALLALGFSEEQYVSLVFTISALAANAIFPNALGSGLDEFSKAYRDIADW